MWHSEQRYGAALADQLYADLVGRGMQIGSGSLTGSVCRDGFVARLAQLLGVEVSIDGMVDSPAGDAWGQGWAGLPVAEAVSEECFASVGIPMRGDTRCQNK